MVRTEVEFRTDPTKLTRPNVAIVGFTDHRRLALELDDTWEVWGLNELHRYEKVERFHRWFEIHGRKVIEPDPDHIKALAAFDIPVYMQREYDDIPPSVAFPKAAVEALCGSYQTSSIAWEISYAILLIAQRRAELGVTDGEIRIDGVDLAQDTEYAQQRPGAEYLIGLARGMGIKVSVPDTSDLLSAVGQYAFGSEGTGFRSKLSERIQWLHNQDNDFLRQIRTLDGEFMGLREKQQDEFWKAREKLVVDYYQKREGLLANRWQVYGAIQDCEYFKRSWAVPGSATHQAVPDRTADPRTGITAQSGDSVAEPSAETPTQAAEHTQYAAQPQAQA